MDKQVFILLILVGIGYSLIFSVLPLLKLLFSKKEHENGIKDNFKKIGYQLMPLVFIFLITFILAHFVICKRGLTFDVSGETQISILGIGAEELTTISVLFYISFWIVYIFRYIPRFFCDKLCYDDNYIIKGFFCCPRVFQFFCKAFYTLGSRLDIISTTRKDSEKMQEKAKVTRTFGTFLIGFCTIFITLIFGFSEKLASINPNYLVLIPGLQLIALILLIIGIDSFDTCLNKFPDRNSELTYVKEYYMRGIRLFYISMQLILLSFLIIAFLINWILTLSMISFFLLVGYAYWFPGLYEFKKPYKLCESCRDCPTIQNQK